MGFYLSKNVKRVPDHEEHSAIYYILEIRYLVVKSTKSRDPGGDKVSLCRGSKLHTGMLFMVENARGQHSIHSIPKVRKIARV